jgi:hypothetical protein
LFTSAQGQKFLVMQETARFGPAAIILAIPAVAVVTTLVDVIVRDRDPAQEDVPTVFFPAKEAER